MDKTRRTAFITGALFVITFVTSIPAALALYRPVLDDANYVVGAGADTGVAMGALLELLLIIANVGTAVALFPILKRQSEGFALGYVTARLVECTFIAIGIVSLLAVVTLRQDLAGAAGGDPGSFVTAGRSLVAVHDWTFLLGPGFVVGVGNGLILGWLMYRSGLVPRGMARLGLVAGPVLLAGRDRRAARRHRAGLGAEEPRGGPRVRVGAVARHLPHGQGLQVIRGRAAPGRSPSGAGPPRGPNPLAVSLPGPGPRSGPALHHRPRFGSDSATLPEPERTSHEGVHL